MDAQKTIKKYVLKSWMKTIGLVFCLAVLVFLVLAFTAMGAADNDAFEFYPNESETGSMAYIDVVGVSDWLYQYDDATYYTVLDAEGYLYTVRLSDSQFKNMKAQYDYWNEESEDAAVPEAYHLVGYVKRISTGARTNIASVWQITTTEYDQYFGEKYIDATTSVGAQNAAPWFFGALMSFLLGGLFLMVYNRSGRNAKKCLKRLEELGLTEKAAEQLENTTFHTVVGKNKGVLSQDFLFGKGTGMVVLYSDILWCYQLNRKVNFVPANSYLMVGTMATAVEAAIDLNRNDRKGVIAEAITIIAQQNPNAMVGYSKEYASTFSAMRKGK